REANLTIEEKMRARRTRDSKVIEDLTEAQIGMVDQTMKALLADRDVTERDLANALNSSSPETPRVKQLKAELDVRQKKIQTYAAEWRDMQKKTGGVGILAASRGEG